MTIHHHPILRADTSLLCWSEILREIVLALTIALATVCIHGFRAAAANPADSLHTE